MKLLITGGAGFIGSHTVVTFIQAGYEVVIIDNFDNAHEQVIDRITEMTGTRPEVVPGDIGDVGLLDCLFGAHQFDGVIHFAAWKAVGESCTDPFGYYQNNIVGTLKLLEVMDRHQVGKLVFSSSTTVYDAQQATPPFTEEMPIGSTTNPYGTSKFIVEQILRDLATWKGLQVITLRYFNPIGAHPSGLIGEHPKNRVTNIFPIMMEVWGKEREELLVFGDDYETPDGSCQRDYLHVVDLAEAHLAAWQALIEKKISGYEPINIGTGSPTSVLELISIVEEVTGSPLPYRVVERRDGDIASSYANPTKAKNLLGWEAKMSITQAVQDGRKFYKNGAKRQVPSTE